MGNSFFAFTDEAGTYTKQPSESFRRSHPFYIRASVLISADDYRILQKELQELNKTYGIPTGEEIKWSDLWEVSKGKYRHDFLKQLSADKMKGYYRKVFELAAAKESLMYIITVTFLFVPHAYQEEIHVLRFHLQEAMQRIQMTVQPDGFATIIMDELNQDKVKLLKEACHKLAVDGDFVKYGNIYNGVLTECSSQSVGIQLADYAVGAMNGYLRRCFLSRGSYEFALDMYTDYIKPNLRKSRDGRIMGYGVREVPKHTDIRQKLSNLFDTKTD